MGICKPGIDISTKTRLFKTDKGFFVSVFVNFDRYELSGLI